MHSIQINNENLLIVPFVLLLLLSIASIIPDIYNHWHQSDGFEYFWIAQSIEQGQGFSFPANHRWLFLDFKLTANVNEYYPTAWEEPIYPFIMASKMKIWGNHGKLAIIIFQTVSLLLTSIFVYLIGKKIFDIYTGLLAGLILSLWPDSRYL